MKITLGVIARNAGRTIGKMLESAAPYVDEIIVGFAGKSTDDTEDAAASFLVDWAARTGADQGEDGLPFQLLNIEWHDDFARARNEVLAKATGDYFLWLDSDDELVNGASLRRWIEGNPQANVFFAAYHYDEDEFGNLSCTLWRERVVRDPATWRWDGAIHEVLLLDEGLSLSMVQIPDVIVRHQPERQKSKGTRNLDILYRELARTEPMPPQRILLYLARENAARGNLHEALLHANRYVSQARFDDEAYQMAYLVAEILRTNKRYDEARKACLKAIEMAPDWPDAYFLLGRLALEEGRFLECIEWTKAGGTKEPPRTSVIIDPRTYSFWPYYFLGLAYRGLGDAEMAIENLKLAASVAPDEKIMSLIAEAQGVLDQQKALNALMAVFETLGRNDEWLKARKLWDVVPKALEMHPEVMRAKLDTYASTQHVEEPQIMIDFYRDNPRWAPMDDEIVLSDVWRQHPRMAFARRSVTCDPPATILDLGSSDGFISLPLAKDGHIVEGYDLDPRCVDLANRRAQDWNLRARYNVGSIEDVEGKYDVAFAFEILEHLVDPRGFLDRLDPHASKVVITTPYLAWENGEVAEWRKVEPKSHLRIYDLLDMEALLTGRGRVFDLYREPYGQTGWIFASYRPRQAYGGTISFVAPHTLEQFGPKKLRAEGLGGSETALIRLAEELFLAGGEPQNSYFPTIYAQISEPGYFSGVRYRQIGEYMPQVRQDAVVAWRYPELADSDVRTDNLILWMHDTDAGDRLTPVRAARFTKIVVLSEWHKAHMLKTYPFLDPSKLVIIGNGVDKERFAPVTGEKVKREPHRVAYTSSPDRGLDLVLEHIWPKVVERVPDAELHFYYGWQAWRALEDSYPHMREFRQKVGNLLLDGKNIVQHGRINQDELAIELQKASVWLYPTYFTETYCISAVEAQVAGAIPITNDLAALAETVRSGIIIKGDVHDQAVLDQYVEAVVQVITTPDLRRQRTRIRANAPAVGWMEVAARWSNEVLA